MISSSDIFNASILIVDDQDANVSLLEQMMRGAGYVSIGSTTDPYEVCELHRQNRYDLILLDLQMPGMDGFQVMERLKEIETGGYLPVLVITAKPDHKLRALKAGAKDFVSKPFDLAEVLIRVYNMLEVRLLHLETKRLYDLEERRKRKVADQALQSSELRYRRLFESAKDGILILDADSGQIVDVNPYLIEMLGISKEELAGKELWEIGAFKDIFASKLAFDELQQREYIRYENLPLESRAGIVRQVEFVCNSYLVGESRVIQCNISDISERKLAEEDLRRTNQRLEGALAELQTRTHELASTTQQLWQAAKLATMGELAASVAHELNNPLATVALRAESVLEALPPGDPKRHALEVISQEVERMATLVSNLLLFSRRSHQQISTVDLREELTNSLDFIQYYLRSHKIDIVLDFAAVLPTVQADRQQLRQVFLNLITNASDAMPEGGTLMVRSRAGAMAGGQTAVVVEFSDTGTGVQTGDLPKLWEPFFTTKPEGKGTGLGLAICRRTVEEHRGTIEIETGPGKGTTVRITLPATEEGIEVAA